MGEECYCNSFDRKTNYFSEFWKTFEVIVSSKFKDKERCEKEEHTSILKCKKCGLYYIWDNYDTVYFENDQISARKYTPKIDEKGLKQVLRNIEGIINEESIDDLSQYLQRIRKIELKRIIQKKYK